LWSNFEYLKPQTLEEAYSLLSRYGSDAKVLAGGTDLMVNMRKGLMKPKYVIDIKGIVGLDQVRYEDSQLKIGSLVTLTTLQRSKLIMEKADILKEATRKMGSVQTRNRATVGGNICNAAPGADTVTPLIAMDARVSIIGSERMRTLPLEEFFTEPQKTVLKPDEILTEILVPDAPPRTGRAFFKYQHRAAMALAIINGGISMTLSEDGLCQNVRIALGAVAPTPMRAKQAEKTLENQRVDEQTIGKAADVASQEIRPRKDSIRASPEYRVELTRILLRRALKNAAEKIKGG